MTARASQDGRSSAEKLRAFEIWEFWHLWGMSSCKMCNQESDGIGTLYVSLLASFFLD